MTSDSEQKKKIGNAIRHHRKEAGYSMVELAKKAGCSPNTLRRIEYGRGVYFGTVLTVVEAIGVPFSEICRSAEEPQPPLLRP